MGGVVRDVLLRLPPKDVDVVVEGDAASLARALARELRGRARVHGTFGTATVESAEGVRLDLATARTERYRRPGALPEVSAGDLGQDLFRRDFTVNAMAARLEPARFGQLVDPFGGRRDLKQRRLQVLHDLSFLDDPTRAFRAARLAARLDFEVAPPTRALLRAALREEVFARLSVVRLSREIERLLSEERPGAAVRRLADLHLLPVLHPDLRLSRRETASLDRMERVLAAGERPWLVPLAMLLGTLPPSARGEALARAVVRPADRALALEAPERAENLLARLSADGVATDRALYEACREEPLPVLWLALGMATRDGPRRRLRRFLEVLRTARADVTGRDLLRHGVPQGPGIAAGLRAALAAKLEGALDKDAQLRAALRAARAP